jgi:ABC-type multidrug transport system ATPase subunit
MGEETEPFLAGENAEAQPPAEPEAPVVEPEAPVVEPEAPVVEPHVENKQDKAMLWLKGKQDEDDWTRFKKQDDWNDQRDSKNDGNVFIFEDVSLTVPYKYKAKEGPNKGKVEDEACIVRDVSGVVKSGETLCIMGPSGAGKTTLLNVLTQNAPYGKCRGTITLNGHELNKELFAKHCAVVPQFDDSWGHLTVQETLEYAAKLYSQPNPEQAAADVMHAMGLGKCADTKVGDALTKGISGGQKKRLCVCMALIKKPTVLFLDEPTSGLDAASATHTTTFMVRMCSKWCCA